MRSYFQYSSVTLSKITTLYFLFALLCMFVQGGFQVASHIANHKANNVLEAIMNKASVKGKVIPVITPNDDGSGDTLRLCNGIPQSDADETCQPVYKAPPTNPQTNRPQAQDAPTISPTTALQDNISTPSGVLFASETPANGITRPSGATSPVNVASIASTAVVAGVSNVAMGPSATAVNPILVSPGVVSASGKQECFRAAVRCSDKVPTIISTAVSPAPTASTPPPIPASIPGPKDPTRSIALPAPGPSTPAPAPSQAPAPSPAQSSDPHLVILSVSGMNSLPLGIDPSIPNDDRTSSTTPIETSTSTAPVPPPAQISVTVSDSVVETSSAETAPTPAPEVSPSSTPAEPTQKDVVESVKPETTEAAKETTQAAHSPIDRVEDTTQAAKTVIGGALGRRSLSIEPIFNQDTGEVIGINIFDLTNTGSNEVVTLNRACALALALPYEE
jgi:hypothetical protein